MCASQIRSHLEFLRNMRLWQRHSELSPNCLLRVAWDFLLNKIAPPSLLIPSLVL